MGKLGGKRGRNRAKNEEETTGGRAGSEDKMRGDRKRDGRQKKEKHDGESYGLAGTDGEKGRQEKSRGKKGTDCSDRSPG